MKITEMLTSELWVIVDPDGEVGGAYPNSGQVYLSQEHASADLEYFRERDYHEGGRVECLGRIAETEEMSR
jgi:hypothetical protein